MADKDDFVHAHLHSDFSSLDGACKIDDYVDEAVKRGNPAIAITDHGTCRGILKLHEATKDKPIKPLYGSEFYVSKDMHRKGLTDDEKKEITKGLAKGEHRAAIKKYEDENGIRDRWHTTIIAQNEVGLRNLYRLSTNSYVSGFYYRPRIDIDELEKYKEGLIVTTGCLSSPVNDCVLAGREREAFEMADRLYEMMGENLYIEIQPHAIRDQRVTNKWAIDNLYERYDKKARLLATQDAHYLNQSDAEHHEVLLCIGTGSNMSDPDRFKFDGDEFHMRTRKEMFAAYRRHHEYIPKHLVTQALNSTIELAERCDAKVHVDYKAALLPKPYTPEGVDDPFQYLKNLCLDGWRTRNIEKRARDLALKRGADFAVTYREYADRLKHELRALVAQKFVPYFLIIHEIYNFARSAKIMCGPGRGSAGGSLVAYLIGVTAVDPIEHGLYFERFISPFRYDLPDCLPPGMLIETARGQVPVEQIAPGDLVLNRDGYRLVEKVHERWHQGQMLTLSDGANDLKLTPNHKVVVDGDGKIEAKKIQAGHQGVYLLRQGVHGELTEPPSLQQGLHLENDLEACQGLRGLPETVHGPEETEGMQQSLRMGVERPQAQLGQGRSTSRFDTHGPVYFGGGFRSRAEPVGVDVSVRTMQDSNCKQPVVHSGFLSGESGKVCGAEGVAGSRFGEVGDSKTNLGEEIDRHLSIGLDGLDEETRLHERDGAVRDRQERNQELPEDLREMQEAFRSNEREALLLFGMCEIHQEGGEVRESWSTRQDGTAMRHLWLGDEYLAERRQQEVLFNALQKQGVCGQTALEIKSAEAYSGPVYDLTINGRHEFFANGILVKNCDMDFEDKRRGEIVDWLVNRFGREHVSQIATIGKLSGKSCIKDVSRVLGVPLPEVMKVTSSIIERSSGDERASQTIEDSFKDFEVCKQFNEKYPKVLYHARHLENLSKTLGIHAAGVVTSPVPLSDLMPMEIRKHNGKDVIVSAYDMYGVAAMGLAKLDVLGLRTLTVIREACEAIKAAHGVTVDFESADFNMNDPKVLKAFTDHDYGGVFQYDTPSADKVCTGVEFTSFDDVAAMTALNRPGTSRSGLATKYVERKKNPKLVEKVDFHPKVTEITKDTLGIMVYQEHVIKIFVELAGFAPGNADSLRKVIAKKIGDETLGKERETFIEGCAKHSGVDAVTANKIMDSICFFGSYGFNRAHAVEYGTISYWTQYLKVYYPLEFYWALLKNEPDRIRIAQYAKQAKKHGIELLPPHVNISKTDFVIDRAHNAIRGSLVDIKGVGPGAADTIMEHQPFKDWFDMQDRVNKAKMHKGVNIALAKSGALKGLVPSTKWFLENIEDIWKIKDKKRQRKDLEAMFDKAKGADDFNDEDMSLQASSVNPLAFGKHPIDAYKEFIERAIKFEAANMSSDDFFTDHGEKGTWIQGVILEVKYNQIGDFHTGPAPTEEEKHDMFWGARYANVNIEDAGGKQNRCKFDIDIFDACRHVIDAGIGTPVVAHVIPNSKFLNLRAQLVVNLASLRDRMKSGVALDVWERIVTGRHPALAYEWKDKETRHKRVHNVAFKASPVGGTFVGVVTNVRLKYDKNGNLMAFFGLMDADGFFIDVIAFHSNWEYVAKAIKQGYLVKCVVEKKPDRTRGWSYFCGDRVKVLSKLLSGTPIE